MRVIECNECGETVSAANDPELADALAAHHADEHDPIDGETAEELVSESAYDATDS